MIERIIIENFGGIKELDIQLNKINLLIGPQASGKSITAKVLYFCKGIFNETYNAADSKQTKVEFDKYLLRKFEDYFPANSWQNENFRIEYQINNFNLSVSKSLKGRLNLEYSDILRKELSHFRRLIKNLDKRPNHLTLNSLYNRGYVFKEKFNKAISIIDPLVTYNQFFIPAGRSFFANLQSTIFSFLSTNKAIDPFLIEFGSLYEKVKNYKENSFWKLKNPIDYRKIDLLINDILLSSYLYEKGKDYLLHPDKRKINLAYASSGQQETLPLMLILKILINSRFVQNGGTVYIEEPEAHLFPKSQKKIVELIATVYNNKNTNLQFFLTTHSPYILSSFNNLLYAGELHDKFPNRQIELNKIVSQDKLLSFNLTNAYSLENGKATDIKCNDSNLISQTILDSVSNEIAFEFDKLLDFDYE